MKMREGDFDTVFIVWKQTWRVYWIELMAISESLFYVLVSGLMHFGRWMIWQKKCLLCAIR